MKEAKKIFVKIIPTPILLFLALGLKGISSIQDRTHKSL